MIRDPDSATHELFILIGPPCSGKSFLIHLMKALFDIHPAYFIETNRMQLDIEDYGVPSEKILLLPMKSLFLTPVRSVNIGTPFSEDAHVFPQDTGLLHTVVTLYREECIHFIMNYV
jgi:hypothetical protein